ncbi:MAG: hypothetical protein JST64_11835, partial [Actinobacteria bacterium]|nr:hypothetical protein [Actinomycetota bacterium]
MPASASTSDGDRAAVPVPDRTSSPPSSTSSPRPSALPSDSTRTERLARLRELAGDLSPLTLARDRALPVLAALEALLPSGLRRGSTVSFHGDGATTLVHAVLAGPTRAGSWAACIGVPAHGWAAAAEMGVDLDRVVVVRADERQIPSVLAALVDAFDVVVVGAGCRLDRSEVRRLVPRARERGAVLLRLHGSAGGSDPWPGPDVELVCESSSWSGPGEGWGHLSSRRVRVLLGGRRALDRPRQVDLWLPGPDGLRVVGGDGGAAAPAGPLGGGGVDAG